MVYYLKRITKFTLNMTHGLLRLLQFVLHVLAQKRLSFGNMLQFSYHGIKQ